MAAERWQRIEKIFKAAIELPAARQAPFLDESCGDDDELRQTVERLLSSDRQAGEFLEEALLSGIELVEDSTQEGSQTIGPYRLIERTGSGGMGAVYRAARADSEYEQIVAIKVIHTGMGSPLTVERFRRERQILAGLEHPNIARLLDGGTTDTGLPYLVMEYIEGEPIDRYCDRLKLSLRERLDLFITVCTAVSSAHQNLVVHRDLKPSNILVTADGTVKLLDFGIAKLLSPEDGGPLSEATLTLERALTPSYASPEQIRGEMVTTASDVYSLGVLLFELIAGRRPFDLSDVTRREAERRVLEDPAPAPSSTLITRRSASAAEKTKPKKSPQVIAQQRGMRPEALRRSLVGDLDTIVLTALRKDRSNRYPSVDKLAQDVRHHLDGLPIDAHPPTFSYRATKFLRRNWLAIAVTAAFFLLTSVFSLILVQRSNLARVEQARTQEVRDLLIEIIQSANPSLQGGAQITHREQLDFSAKQIERRFSQQPLLQADLQVQLVDSYLSLGLAEEARVLIEKAITTRGAVVGEEDPSLSKAYHRLGASYRKLGDFARAETLHRKALKFYKSGSNQELTRIADVTNDLGIALRAQGRWEEAERYFREALELYREAPGDQRQWIAVALGNLGNVLGLQNRSEEGEGYLREALAIDRELSNAEPSTAIAADLSLLGNLLLNKPDLQASAEHHGLALSIRRQLLEPDHPDLLESINNLASAHYKLRHYEEAIPLFREAEALWSKKPDRRHPDYASLQNNLGLALQGLGRFDEAAESLMQALQLRRALMPTSPDVVNSLINTATLHYDTGDSVQARDLYAQAVEVEGVERQGSYNHALALAGLGASHRSSGDFEAAVPPLREALEVIHKLVGDDHLATVYFSISLARVLSRTGFTEEAEELLRKAVKLRRQGEASQPRLGKALTLLADHLARHGEAEEAEAIAKEAVAILEASTTEDDPLLANARNVLGASLVARGKLQEGDLLIARSIDRLTQIRGANHPDTEEARARAVSAFLDRGAAGRAAAYRDR